MREGERKGREREEKEWKVKRRSDGADEGRATGWDLFLMTKGFDPFFLSLSLSFLLYLKREKVVGRLESERKRKRDKKVKG